MRRRTLILGTLSLLTLQSTVFADTKNKAANPYLSPVFTDNMVLQRGIKAPVWGWTTPGASVKIEIAGKTATTVADDKGKWMAKVGPLPVGGPYTLTVTGPENVTLQNVLVGDVWICSGQSNMEQGIGITTNFEQEIADANYPQIRLMTVQKGVQYAPQNTFTGKWDVCSPQTVSSGGWGGFSGVGYYFGRSLHKELKVPIGLIHTSWGGTIAEAWTSAEALQTLPDFQPRVAQVLEKRANNSPVENNPNVSTVLYNAMISPLVPFGIKGAIWYQGESNAGRAYQYRSLLPTMIKDWRSRFGVGDFPFFIVQLANFQDTKPEPGDDAWAELREAQWMTVQNTPKTGLAVAIDIGEAKDIHPRNKQDVGKRLALSALSIAYGKKVVASGPTYKSMKIAGNAIHLSFNSVGSGLMAKNGEKLQGFAIAGRDKKFVWADAVIEGNTIKVSSPLVPSPSAVRYAWAINPICNLYNKEGLPAVPFRTDDWPGVTVNNK